MIMKPDGGATNQKEAGQNATDKVIPEVK